MSRHKIFRQQMHLQFQGQPAPGAGPEQLAAFTRDRLMPAMEKVLDQHSRPGATLRIPQLTLDAGTLTGPNWPEQLTTALCRQLDLYLRECLTRPQPEAEARSDKAAWVPNDEQTTLLQTLLHYLRTGMLPWHAQGTRPPLHTAAITLAEQPDFYQSATYTELLHQPLMLKRWLLLLPFSTALQAMLGPQLTHPLRLQMEALAEIGVGEKTAPEARRRLLLTLLLYQLHQVPAAAWQQQCQWYGIPAWFGSAPNAQLGFPSFTQQTPPPQALHQIAQWLQQAAATPTANQSATKPMAEAAATGDTPAPYRTREPEQITNEAPGTETLSVGSSIPVEHAGIVLLHPFLPAFFQALRLTNEQQNWAESTSAQTAVCRLFALANPDSPLADYDLALAKLLCGWPESLPIAPVTPPEPWELAEMNSLLEAVLQHWQRLGSTSPDGLRQAFLQRSGTLTKQPAGWELTISSGSYDVLLTTLPWGISMVKTPWMSNWLRVSWS